jgi:hypothetical protein
MNNGTGDDKEKTKFLLFDGASSEKNWAQVSEIDLVVAEFDGAGFYDASVTLDEAMLRRASRMAKNMFECDGEVTALWLAETAGGRQQTLVTRAGRLGRSARSAAMTLWSRHRASRTPLDECAVAPRVPIIEAMYPALPEIKLFVRQSRPGWEATACPNQRSGVMTATSSTTKRPSRGRCITDESRSRKGEGENMMTDEEREVWLAIRKEAGLKIDPETAEVDWNYASTTDPYGIYPPLPDEVCDCVGREHFARAPGNDVWVHFDDLPKATREALWKKHELAAFVVSSVLFEEEEQS